MVDVPLSCLFSGSIYTYVSYGCQDKIGVSGTGCPKDSWDMLGSFFYALKTPFNVLGCQSS